MIKIKEENEDLKKSNEILVDKIKQGRQSDSIDHNNNQTY